MATIVPPNALTLIAVRVPTSLWGHDLSTPDKAIAMVEKYLYGRFTVVGCAEGSTGWIVTVLHLDYDKEPNDHAAISQQDRLLSGGMGSLLMGQYMPANVPLAMEA
jgi:hypothetical protein